MPPQTNQPPEPAPVQPRPVQPRTSVTAIVAIVLAAIPLCPFISLAGSVVGLVAINRIRRTGRRGRTLALTAVFLGAAQAIGWSLLGQYFANSMRNVEHEQAAALVEQFITATTTADAPAARSTLTQSASQAASDESLLAFGTALRDAFGSFRHVRINSMSPVSGVFDQRRDVALVIHCESTSTTAAARLVPRQSFLNIIPSFQLERIVIDRPGGADLELPPPPASDTIGATPAAPPSQ